MDKLFKICMIVAVTLGFAGCYNDFDDPAPTKVWTSGDFVNEKMISIKDFKQLFYEKYGDGTASLGKTLEITED